MLKKVVSLFCVLCLVMSLGVSNVVASENIQEEATIEVLLDGISSRISKKMLEDDPTVIQRYESEIEMLEHELTLLEVRCLTEEELEEYGVYQNDVVARIIKPDHSDTIKWYLYESTDRTYNSKSYDIQRLIAVGYDDGALVTGENNKPLLTEEESYK